MGTQPSPRGDRWSTASGENICTHGTERLLGLSKTHMLSNYSSFITIFLVSFCQLLELRWHPTAFSPLAYQEIKVAL